MSLGVLLDEGIQPSEGGVDYCNYAFPIDLTPNGILLGAKLMERS